MSGNGSSKISHRDYALKRLHVTKEALAAAPQITSMLRQASGGLKTVVDAMRFTPDEVSSAFLAKYDSLSEGDRQNVPIEAVALGAGINPSNLLGSALVALQAQTVNTVKIIALSGHPAITRARVKFGQRPSGERDRTALDTAMGFLPNPKGPTFIGKAIFGSGKQVMDAQGAGNGDEDAEIIAGDDEPDLDKLFPPANETQEELIPIRNRLLSENN